MLRSNQLSYATGTGDSLMAVPARAGKTELGRVTPFRDVRRLATGHRTPMLAGMDLAANPAAPRVADERLLRLTAPAGRKVLALATREGQGAFLRVGLSVHLLHFHLIHSFCCQK